MKSSLLVGIVAFAIGLGSQGTYVPIAWELSDQPKEQRIDIRFLNKTRRTLCIDEDNLPTSKGTMLYSRDRVALIVGGHHYAIRNFDPGHCEGGCTVRLPFGASISASIPYSEFSLPARMWHRKKKLVYPLNAQVCE